MGVLYYLFTTTSIFACGVEVIIGDQKNEDNPFYWDSLVHNFPENNECDPYMPRLYW